MSIVISTLVISNPKDKSEWMKVIDGMTPSEIVKQSLVCTESRKYGISGYACWLLSVRFKNYTINVNADPVFTRKMSQRNTKQILIECIKFGRVTVVDNQTYVTYKPE